MFLFAMLYLLPYDVATTLDVYVSTIHFKKESFSRETLQKNFVEGSSATVEEHETYFESFSENNMR